MPRFLIKKGGRVACFTKCRNVNSDKESAENPQHSPSTPSLTQEPSTTCRELEESPCYCDEPTTISNAVLVRSQPGDNFIRSVSIWTADHALPLDSSDSRSLSHKTFFCPVIPLAVTGLLVSKLRAAYGFNFSRKDIALRDEGCRSISVAFFS